MYKLEPSYYEDEVREGFFVPSVIKKAWAADLLVLSEFQRICDKYNLKYYAAYGTLLGAIRHGGYIPWDDDLDILMKRSDFEKFMEVAPNELQDLILINHENNEDFWFFLTRVSTGVQLRFEEDYLEKMHGFPYISGIDIFVLDTLSTDGEEERKRDIIVNFILAVADNIENREMLCREDIAQIRKIESIIGKKIEINAPIVKLRKELYKIATSYFSIFEGEKDGKIARLMPDILGKKKRGLPRAFFEDTVNIPFETGTIMAPAMYDAVLSENFGKYLNIYKDQGDHTYPFFEKQKANFEMASGMRFPEYTFSKEVFDRQKATSYKQFISEYLEQIKIIICDCKPEELADAQELAIAIGNYLDETRTDCDCVIRILERFCEELYILHCKVGSEERNLTDIERKKMQLISTFDEANKEIDKLIFSKNEVVFLPFNAKHWKMIETQYNEEIQNPNNDVYVIPIPYYYKKYDDTIMGEVFNPSEYPDNLRIIDYKEYDWENRHPDKVYIQYPYDAWNSETIIDKKFFSYYLWQNTEELIYVPYFRVADFDRNCTREYYNMKYYCTMPAVINSDKIILNSEKLKRVYIDKLVEFTGSEYEEYWNRKILVEEDFVPKIHKDKIRVLYFVSFSSLYQYKNKAIDKMKKSLEIIKNNNEGMEYVFKIDPVIELNSQVLSDEVRKAYYELLDGLREADCIQIISKEDALTDGELVEMCDAYYGDPSYLANWFTAKKKKVMIEDIAIL